MTPPRSPSLDDHLARRLAALEGADLLRRLEEPAGVDFTSNDYLGLARDPSLARALEERLAPWLATATDEDDAGAPLAAPSSRLLRGHTGLHRRVEERMARWRGAEAALLFPSGFQANLGLLGALVGPEDRVLSDRLNHASLIDGLRLARPGRKVVFPHASVDAVAEELARPWPGGRTVLVTESLFSMDGDLAPLADYAPLCRRHGADLVVDEAHATGLYGATGAGRVEELGLGDAVAATVTTFGKSLALAGAAVTGSETLVRWLVNRARSFVFSTAVAPLALVALEAVLDLVGDDPARGRRARERAARLRRRLAEGGLAVPGDDSPIVPVVLGSNARALAVAQEVRRRGFDVRAVRPPTVPEGTARLRISVHADHDEATVDALAAAVLEARAAVDAGAGTETDTGTENRGVP